MPIRLLLLTLLFLHPLAAEKSADVKTAEKSADTEAHKGKVTVEKPDLIESSGLTLGARYARFSRSRPFGHYPYYSDYWGWYPHDHPVDYWSFSRTGGRIKLKTKHKEASVYLDGAFAGLAKDLKEIWLDPGVYELKVEPEQHRPFEIRVYVLTGKTVRIEPKFEAGPQE